MSVDSKKANDEAEALSTLPFKAEIKGNILEITAKSGAVKNRVKAGLYLFDEDDALDLSMYQLKKYAGMTSAEIKRYDLEASLVLYGG